MHQACDFDQMYVWGRTYWATIIIELLDLQCIEDVID